MKGELPRKFHCEQTELNLTGIPGKPFKTVASELAHSKSEKTQVLYIHQLPSVINGVLFLGCINSMHACWLVFQLPELHLLLLTFSDSWSRFCPYTLKNTFLIF